MRCFPEGRECDDDPEAVQRNTEPGVFDRGGTEEKRSSDEVDDVMAGLRGPSDRDERVPGKDEGSADPTGKFPEQFDGHTEDCGHRVVARTSTW